MIIGYSCAPRARVHERDRIHRCAELHVQQASEHMLLQRGAVVLACCTSRVIPQAPQSKYPLAGAPRHGLVQLRSRVRVYPMA